MLSTLDSFNPSLTRYNRSDNAPVLPLRDEPSKTKVQRISLGLRADAAGLQEARETLHQVQRQLDRDRFNWESTQLSHLVHVICRLLLPFGCFLVFLLE